MRNIRVKRYQRNDGTIVKSHNRTIRNQFKNRKRIKIAHETNWLQSHEGRITNEYLNFDQNELDITCKGDKCYMKPLKKKKSKEERYLNYQGYR